MNSMNLGLKSANNNKADKKNESLNNGIKILGASAITGALLFGLGLAKGKSKKK